MHPEIVSALRTATHVLAYRADSDARFLTQTATRHQLTLPSVPWADVRPAYVGARTGGRQSLAAAMRREGLTWQGKQHRAETDCRALLSVMRALAT